jgi:hypothetical protein
MHWFYVKFDSLVMIGLSSQDMLTTQKCSFDFLPNQINFRPITQLSSTNSVTLPNITIVIANTVIIKDSIHVLFVSVKRAEVIPMPADNEIDLM